LILSSDVLEEAPAVFQTPRRRKSKKAREKLDDSFLRRSRRLSKKKEGFKNAESARMNKSKDVLEQAAEEEVQEPTPLAIIPPGPSMTGAAPHLSKRNSAWNCYWFPLDPA
jgi:hypothetical protein